jgi:hypothetical protein
MKRKQKNLGEEKERASTRAREQEGGKPGLTGWTRTPDRLTGWTRTRNRLTSWTRTRKPLDRLDPHPETA